MKKTDLKDVLDLVKDKLQRDVEAACGLFWPDRQATTYYAIGEEDATTEYSVGEEDCTTDYSVGECDDPVVRYAIKD